MAVAHQLGHFSNKSTYSSRFEAQGVHSAWKVLHSKDAEILEITEWRIRELSLT